MDKQALAAHARLAASLPAWRHRSEPPEPIQRSLVGYPTEGTRPGRAAAEDSPLRVRTATRSRQIAADVVQAKARPKPKPTKAQAFKVLPARQNKWGFVRGDELEVANDGGSWAGMRVAYIGTASTTWVYVRAAGMKVSVRVDRLRRGD